MGSAPRDKLWIRPLDDSSGSATPSPKGLALAFTTFLGSPPRALTYENQQSNSAWRSMSGKLV